ncbi:hypothetical protein BGX29_010143 [Mortierella sp. GBA35]|nr:hypothetical protein BGX29_010143 [Mortierella sp. GBA35]
MHSVFKDSVGGDLDYLAARVKDTRARGLINNKVVAHIVPETVSTGSFPDAAGHTHADLIKSHEADIVLPILSNMNYPCADGVHHPSKWFTTSSLPRPSS